MTCTKTYCAVKFVKISRVSAWFHGRKLRCPPVINHQSAATSSSRHTTSLRFLSTEKFCWPEEGKRKWQQKFKILSWRPCTSRFRDTFCDRFSASKASYLYNTCSIQFTHDGSTIVDVLLRKQLTKATQPASLHRSCSFFNLSRINMVIVSTSNLKLL